MNQKRLEVGLIAITDYAEAKASYDLSETNVIEAENKVIWLKNHYMFLQEHNLKPSLL